MKGIFKKDILIKIAVSFSLSLITPFAFTFLYKLNRSYILIALFSIVTNILFLIMFILLKENKYFLPRKTLIIVITALYTCLSLYILFKLMLTPFPIFKSWLFFVQNNMDGGNFSYLYIFLICFFSSLFAGLIYKYGYAKSLSGIISSVIIILSLSFYNTDKSFVFLILSIISLMISAALIARVPGSKNAVTSLSSLTVFILSAVIALTAYYFTRNTGGWITNFKLSPRIETMIRNIIPDMPYLPESDGYQEYGESKTLGGSSFYHNQPVFMVEASPDDVIYLRTKIFQDYNIILWERNPLLKESSEDFKGFDYGISDAADKKIGITLLADYYNIIPHTLDTKSFIIHGADNIEYNFGGADTGYQIKLPLLKGARITINADSHDNENKSDLLNENIYLEVPKNLSYEFDKIGLIKDKSSSQTQILKTITAYLNDNYKYSVRAKAMYENEDYVYQFLFNDKKGYCEHFASSLVMLARHYNIPARFVTGYLIYMPEKDNKMICTGMMAHAWAEVRLKDKGWVTWEATPAAGLINNPDYKDLLKNYDEATAKQLNKIFSYKINKDKEKISLKLIIALSASFLLFIIVLIFFIRILKLNRHKSIYRNTGRRKTYFIIKKITKKTDGIIEPPALSGWTKWSDNIKNGFAGIKTDILLKTILKYFYSDNPLNNREIRQLNLFNRKLKRL